MRDGGSLERPDKPVRDRTVAMSSGTGLGAVVARERGRSHESCALIDR